jgi:hypothetical protein
MTGGTWAKYEKVKVRGSEGSSSCGVWTQKKEGKNVSLSYAEWWSDKDLNPTSVWLHVVKSFDGFTLVACRYSLYTRMVCCKFHES